MWQPFWFLPISLVNFAPGLKPHTNTISVIGVRVKKKKNEKEREREIVVVMKLQKAHAINISSFVCLMVNAVATK